MSSCGTTQHPLVKGALDWRTVGIYVKCPPGGACAQAGCCKFWESCLAPRRRVDPGVGGEEVGRSGAGGPHTPCVLKKLWNWGVSPRSWFWLVC